MLGSIVVARCIPKGTMVHTKRGMVPVEEMHIGDKVMTCYGIYQKVCAVFEKGVQKTIRIRTRDGGFRCTPNHQMAVLTQGNIKWKKACDLTRKDCLINTRFPVKGVQISFSIYNQTNIPLNPDMAWFIGYYLQSKHDMFRACNIQIANKLKDNLLLFEPTMNVVIHHIKNDKFIVIATHPDLKTCLEILFPKERIPEFIWRGVESVRYAFLAGVIDSSPNMCISSISKDWIHHLQILFYSCGIETRMRRKRFTTTYQLIPTTTSSKDIIKNMLGLVDREKIKTTFLEKFYDTPYQFLHSTCVVNTNEEEKQELTFNIMIENENSFYANGYLTNHNSEEMCLTADTMIMTTNGYTPIKELVGKSFDVIADGQVYTSTTKGFWHTGKKPIYRVLLENGIDIKASSNHYFMTFGGWKRVGELSIEDTLLLSSCINIKWSGKGTEDEGYIAGFLIKNKLYYPSISIMLSNNINPYKFGPIQKISDYYYKKKGKLVEFKMVGQDICYKKYSITSNLFLDIAKEYNIFGNDGKINIYENGSYDFTIGLLMGVFDSSGIIYNNIEDRMSIRLWDYDRNFLRSIQRLLLAIGIVSNLMEHDNIQGYELIIRGDENMFIFQKKIGFLNNEKSQLLSQYQPLGNRIKNHYCSRMVSIESYGEADVYDCTIEKSHFFSANGVLSHNCA